MSKNYIVITYKYMFLKVNYWVKHVIIRNKVKSRPRLTCAKKKEFTREAGYY